jgi:hypothetical protein
MLPETSIPAILGFGSEVYEPSYEETPWGRDRSLITEQLRRADQHVADGERHITQQRQLIAKLEQDGHDTKMAIELLATFEQLQATHIAHRDRIRDELAQPL